MPARFRIDGAVVLAAARHPALPAFDGAQDNELVGVMHRQRPQQDVADEAEDRGVGADAEREGKQGDGGEAGVLQQLTDGYPDVVQQLVTPRELAGDRPIPARCSLDGREGAKRCEPVAGPSRAGGSSIEDTGSPRATARWALRAGSAGSPARQSADDSTPSRHLRRRRARLHCRSAGDAVLLSSAGGSGCGRLEGPVLRRPADGCLPAQERRGKDAAGARVLQHRHRSATQQHVLPVVGRDCGIP